MRPGVFGRPGGRTHLYLSGNYARVSTDRQAQKDLSIPAQLSAMKDFAKKKGCKIIGTYIDAGESAKTANRPELKNLLKFCREKGNQVDAIMVHKIDRLAGG